MHRAKEGDREGYKEKIWEREGKREQDVEWEKDRERSTQFGEWSINGPSNRVRVKLMLKLDELLKPSMTFGVILIQMKYLRIHNISIHTIFFIKIGIILNLQER